MSNVSGLDDNIWKYLIEHFKVYGFAAQNKKLIANLQKYGGIKQDVFYGAEPVKAQVQRITMPEQRTVMPEQCSKIPEQCSKIPEQRTSVPVLSFLAASLFKST